MGHGHRGPSWGIGQGHDRSTRVSRNIVGHGTRTRNKDMTTEDHHGTRTPDKDTGTKDHLDILQSPAFFALSFHFFPNYFHFTFCSLFILSFFGPLLPFLSFCSCLQNGVTAYNRRHFWWANDASYNCRHRLKANNASDDYRHFLRSNDTS